MFWPFKLRDLPETKNLLIPVRRSAATKVLIVQQDAMKMLAFRKFNLYDDPKNLCGRDLTNSDKPR